MQARDQRMQRLGRGRAPSSVELRAAAFLADAQPTLGLAATEVDAIERRLLRKRRAGLGLRLSPVLAALALLLLTGSGMAVVGGWRPRLPFLDRSRPAESAPAGATRPARKVAHVAPPAPTAPGPVDLGTPSLTPAVSPPPPAIRRVPRGQPVAAAVAPGEDRREQLSAEARSLADALARWRRDGDGEAALALLDAHDRRFVAGVLSVEAKVARAEILLAVGRRARGLAVLDSLDLAGLPRARELATLRGELRAEAGRCAEARADLGGVLGDTANDDLRRRAGAALARCR